MSEIADRIRALDDARAVRLLTTVAKALQRPDDVVPPTDELRAALALLAPGPPSSGSPTVADGDLARTALLVLAANSAQAAVLQALLDGPEPERYSTVGLVLAVGAVLVALQTRGKFVRKDGKTEFEIAKPSLPTGKLVELAREFTAWLAGK